MTETLQEKEKRLLALLRGYGGVAVAFSGGVDSTFLAAAARRVLQERAAAITACSALLPDHERRDARRLAAAIGIRHFMVEMDELNDPELAANDQNRCYYCKRARLAALGRLAKASGLPWVAEGSNVDDDGDFRPGRRAVRENAMVVSPLLEAGLTKADIRELSRAWRLETWDKPSAACLASRLAYGLALTKERLRQVDLAEAAVRRYCAGQVRVRHHGDLARLEVSPDELPRLAAPETAAAINARLKEIGFTFVAVDLQGYRMGSHNEALLKKER